MNFPYPWEDAASAREVNDGSDAVDEWCPKHVSVPFIKWGLYRALGL